MKKYIFTLIYCVIGLSVLAGGIVTNSNQSAGFIRNPAQDATLGIHAVYYNPAGLTQLNNGFHLSLNNQFISQERTVSTSFPGLNQNTFIGDVKAPLFPSVYAVFKRNKVAVSVGFNPIGGGGSADYQDGLPSFEMQVAALPGLLSQSGIPTKDYSYETEFNGSSVYYGLQGAFTYQVSEVVSLSLGARYVMVDNMYEGYLRDVRINPIFPPLGYDGSMESAPTFFSSMAGLFGNLSGVAESLQPLVQGGGGELTLGQAQALGHLSAEEVAAIAGGFALIDPSINPMMLNMAQIQGAYAQATPAFEQQQQNMLGYAAATSNKEVEASQSGTGIVPIIGINLNFDALNIGIKYEHKASIKVKNETKVDDVGLYPDGAEVSNDMPAMLAIGASFDLSERLKLSAGYHTYFDKDASYGKMLNNEFVSNDKVIDKNLWEFAMGVDFWLSNKFMLSAGYLFTETGVMKEYQTDLGHSLSTFSFGGGLLFRASEMIDLNLGAMRTFYSPDVRNFGSYGETYARKALVLAIGLDFHF